MQVSSAFVVIMGMGGTFVGLTCIIFLTILMGKIAKWFNDLGWLAFKDTVSTNDVSAGIKESLRKADSAVNVPVTAADNGKFLRVVNGVWAAATVDNANGVSF